jgi:hypothetical protein
MTLLPRPTVRFDFTGHSPFLTPFLLAGTASLGLPLRACGTAGFCFVAKPTPSGFWLLRKISRASEIFRPLQKSSPGPGEQAPLALGCPARSRAEKE